MPSGRADHVIHIELIATIHDLAANHNNKETCDIAILDFSTAFDVVPHQRLLHNHMYGIRNKNLEWIKSFLTRRHQRTLVNGKTSDWLPVLSGIPQGTVLGPHLFILCISTTSRMQFIVQQDYSQMTVYSIEPSLALQMRNHCKMTLIT